MMFLERSAMKNLYLLTLLFLNPPAKEVTVLDILQSTENPPIVSFEEKVSFLEADEVVYAAASVNIRTAPNVDGEKVSTASLNQEIHRIGIGSNGWSQIIYEDKICYMNSRYLSNEKIEIIGKPLEAVPLGTSSQTGIIGGEGNVDAGLLSLAQNYFSKIPRNVVNFLEASEVHIYITDTNLADRFFAGQYSSVMGCTVYAEKNIYIEDRNSAVKSSIIHETGHIIDYLCGWASSSAEFQDCYILEKDSFVEVGKQDNNNTSSISEFFAEVWNQIVLHPESCRASAPGSYEYVLNVMNGL